MSQQPRVIVIGVGGLDPSVCLRLQAENKLPNFSKLHFNQLTTTTPSCKEVLWSVAACGVNPGELGIFDSISRDPANYQPYRTERYHKKNWLSPVLSSGQRCTPFWSTLQKRGIQCSTIGWPVSYPVCKGVGRLFAEHGAITMNGAELNSLYFTSAAEEIGRGDIGTVPVSVVNSEIVTALCYRAAKRAEQDLNVPLKISLGSESCAVFLQGAVREITVGSWSAPIRLSLRSSIFSKRSMLFRAYLISVRPTFKLYIRPLQPAPYLDDFDTLNLDHDFEAQLKSHLPLEGFEKLLKLNEAWRERIFWSEFDRADNKVLSVVFNSAEKLKSLYWDSSITKVPSKIEEYYLEKDRFLGDLLGRIGADDKVILFSPSGFGPLRKFVNINTWLKKAGFLKTRHEMPSSHFEAVNWSKTEAYAVGYGGIYLNQKEREKNGILEERHREQVLSQIERSFAELRYGLDPVVSKVYRRDGIYKGKYLSSAPDLILGLAPGYRVSYLSAIGGIEEELFSSSGRWIGHSNLDKAHVPGILFTNFSCAGGNLRIEDLAGIISG